MTISFANPPINEVVIGRLFEPRPDFLVPHIGLLWQLIQSEFPGCQHATPISASGVAPSEDPQTGLILPRVWLLSEDRTNLLQIQNGRFYFNWRQTELAEPYERFESVYGPFIKYLELFEGFFATQFGDRPSWQRCELTYVNVFKRGQGWDGFSDLSGVFRGLRLPTSAAGGALSHAGVRMEFALAEVEGKLVVSINPAKNAKSGEPVLKVELAASSGQSLTEEESKRWFSEAHLAIVKGFCDLTTDTVQKDHWVRLS